MPTVNLTLTGQAFASVNDTNVTLTLGGTPSTALLKGVSITAGWTGQLSVARGGTGLGALGTANQLLRVNALGTALEYFTPSYGTGTVTSFAFTDSTGITGSVLNATTTPTLSLSLTSAAVGLGNVENTALSTWAGSTNLVTLGAAVTGTGSLTLGTSSSVAGTLVLKNATNAFTQTIRGTNPAASIIYDLPTTAPTLGQVLSATAPAAGVVTLSWATAASGITVGTTTVTSGTTGSILMDIGGIVTESKSYRAEQATPFGTFFGFEAASSGSYNPLSVNNTFVGYQAGKNLVYSPDNTFIGYQAGINMATGSSALGSNTCVGSGAGSVLTTGFGNTLIGKGANVTTNSYSTATVVGSTSTAGGSRAVVIGANTFATGANSVSVGTEAFAQGTKCVSIGDYQGYNVLGDYNILIGIGTFNSLTLGSSIGIGYSAQPQSAHQMVLGGNHGNGYIDNVYFNGVTHTAPYSVTLHASHGSGTNIGGANFTIDAGNATGTGAAGNFKVTSSVKGSSGTTLQTSGDRFAIIGKYVDITGGAATTFGQLALATSSTISGGEVMYTIEANDGTDFQSLTGVLKYDVVNKAGALTVTYSDVQNGAGACSAGTLTATVTAAVSGTNVLFQANAVSSLVETVLRVSFQVINNFGVATITAA